MYSLFTFKALHNLHLGLSKLVREYRVEVLFSDRPVAKGPVKWRWSYLKFQALVRRGCNLLRKMIKIDVELPGIIMRSSKVATLDGGNGLFTANLLQGMLEGKDYQAVDGVFPFVAAFIDEIIRHEWIAPLTKAYRRYRAMLCEMTWGGGRWKWTK